LLKKFLAVLALVAAMPLVASAATIAASQIPDGTYHVVVTSVIDATHINVTLDDGDTTTLAAGRATVNFTKVKPNDALKLSLGKGAVLVYVIVTGTGTSK
jgi:hypothetical protein